jgi:hypothetical protein
VNSFAVSWLPTWGVIDAKLLELRKRRALMIVTVTFTVALPVIFYGIRLTFHLGNPARYAPDAFATAGILMGEFGFIAATALGATAGTGDLSDGMFRHLVITGRSRISLYLARIPAGFGLGSLMGQRTVPVILLVVLELIITPVLADHPLPFFINGERAVVGVAMDQLKPAALAGGTQAGPGGGGLLHLPPMPAWAMVTVIVGWIVGWTAIGAWKMATRDA